MQTKALGQGDATFVVLKPGGFLYTVSREQRAGDQRAKKRQKRNEKPGPRQAKTKIRSPLSKRRGGRRVGGHLQAIGKDSTEVDVKGP